MELMENPNYKFRISCSPNPVGEHRHRHLELAYIAKGTILHNINGRTERIDEGNYFIIDHRTYHSYEKVSDKPLFVVNLIFYPEFLDRTLVGKYRFDDLLNCFLLKFSYKSLKSPVTNMTFSDKNGQVQAIVEDILQEYQTENYGYMEYIRCQLVRIFIIAMRQVGKNDELPDYNKTVTEIINIIDKRYSEKLRLSDVAKQLGYSTEYLST
ncbi:MAG: AraC family ligand binding domain-containing protein, partial [Clostridia bacterium]|nr:AraC family ligand binding domain-containing protein [Clostridia bacterium]